MAKARRSTNKRQRVSSGKSRKKKETAPDPFFTKTRIRKFFGFSFLLTAIFLTVAFLSYFFTWKADQDMVLDASWQLVFSNGLDIRNHLGSLGALFSHIFFYDLFGVSSFLVILVLSVWGINLVAGKKVVRATAVSLHSIFGILWVSCICGLLAGEREFAFAGGMGNLTTDWLTSIIGQIGLSILLVFIGGIYLYYNINRPRYLAGLLKLRPRDILPGDIDLVPRHIRELDDFEDVIPEPIDLTPEVTPSKADLEKAEQDDKTFTHRQDETFEAIEKEPYLVEREDEAIDDALEKSEAALKVNGSSKASRNGIDPDDLELAIEQVKEEKIESSNKISEKAYDPTLDLAKYKYPTLDLLDDHGEGHIQIDKDELEANKNQIIETLSHYNIKISKIKATVGPTVTLYEIVPAPGVRISKIKNLEDDVALSLAALGIRIIAPIPGKGTIGIEVPNAKKTIVSMKYMLASEKFRNTDMTLPVAIGKTIANEIYITDLAKMPHLLMAGATGQGKSVGLNAILVSLLYKLHPSELKFVMVDPKKVELTLYKRIEKHYLAKLPGEEDPIITDTKKVIYTLNALCIEMDERYELLKNAQVRNIKEYNEKFKARKLNPLKGHRFLPYIVLVVDEFADLMMTAGKEVEMPIARLAQLARAIGIHLVIATQRPSVNIITGVIKANFPGRMAFKVTSKVDSRTILDASGADQLIGRGDMLLSINGNIIRLQCPFVDTPEVEKITRFIEEQKGYEEAFMLPEYVDPKEASGPNGDPLDDKDPMFEDAARVVVMHQQGSTSLIQRRLKLGYNRAGRIMDQLEAAGVVGPNAGSKAREVYIPDEYELERFLQQLGEEV
jgi:S-DNA-T family DNA segregation ATPase FtsK/SpoIIIE